MPAARPAGASSRSARASASSVAALSARGGVSTSTAARSRRPNGCRRRASSAPSSSPATIALTHVAGQAALGVVGDAAAQQLERDHRDGLVERQTVELGQRPAVLGRDEPGLRRRPLARRGVALRGARHRQRQRAAGQLATRCVAAAAAGAGALAQLVGQRGDRGLLQRGARGAAGEHLAAGVEDDRRAADQRGERAGDAVEPALGQHDPLEPLVRGQRTLQDRVVLVDQVRERLLGDRDERHLVRDLEQREAQLVRRGDHLVGHRLCAKPVPRPRPDSPWPARRATYSRCELGPLELQPGRQQQLAARQPRRRVDDLGDVDPADGVVDAGLPGDQPDLEVAQQVTESEHRFVTGRRGSYADSYKLPTGCAPAQRPERLSRVAGMPLAYDRTGSGPPLVLVHGLGSCKEMWQPVVPLLARTRDVITVDLPGFGASAAGPRDRRGARRRGGGARRRARPRRLARGRELDGRGRRARARRARPRALGLRRVADRVRQPPRDGLRARRAGRDAGHVPRPASRWPQRSRATGCCGPRSPHTSSPGRGACPPATPCCGRGCTPTHRPSAPAAVAPDWRVEPASCPTTVAWGERDRLLIFSRQAPRARRVLPQARHVTLTGCGHTADVGRPGAGRPRAARSVRLGLGALRQAGRSPRPRASAAA